MLQQKARAALVLELPARVATGVNALPAGADHRLAKERRE